VVGGGGEPPPAAAPSLWRDAPPEVVSELYLTNGSNRFSLVDGDLQLLQESRFAAPAPDYFQARQAALQRKAQAPPSPVFVRLTQEFDRMPPFAGDGGAGAQSWRLERWLAAGGTARVEDPEKAVEMARRLADGWHRFVPDELSPEGESSAGKDPEKHHGRWRKRR
jgi:hypothetical protein